MLSLDPRLQRPAPPRIPIVIVIVLVLGIVTGIPQSAIRNPTPPHSLPLPLPRILLPPRQPPDLPLDILQQNPARHPSLLLSIVQIPLPHPPLHSRPRHPQQLASP